MTDPLSIAGALNFRDTGGLAAGAARTRSGVLFRSGNLTRVDAGGRESLRALGLRRIVDLREDAEIALEPTRLEDLGHETVRIPLFVGSAASFFEDDLSLSEMYRALIEGSSAGIVDVVRAVLADQPVLVHCTVGKDRTGVTIALTLVAAGVDEDAVVADYARTEQLLPAWRNESVLTYLRRLHPHARHLEDLATRSPAPAMQGMLDELRTQYGAPVEFLRANGLADEEIQELRRVLIEGIPAHQG
ncbi:tyrosine-protein phosphatase [Microbacterium invictum]|uniref:Protein-tyrosine phosphatase n=1 Tax=Microbacterium invictum TaxID=515415 RepID=A0AA40SP44_9MICO|nr:MULTISPECIES: tyrosine-protein phosphatase [Microbacterium]MBB4139677.1 protein-tyrosine phosphatase [Microbacterium invictum]